MGKEFEIQILDVNVTKMKKILKENKGKKIHKNIRFERAVFNRCNSKIRGFVRVRNEGKNTTMTVKVYNNKKFPDEYEVTIKDDFETGKKFIEALNLKMTAYQETYREKWSLPIKGVHEITFDTWPGLPTYMEIDCDNKKTLNKVIKLFNPDKDKIAYGPTGKKYETYYGISEKYFNNKISSVTFKTINKYIKPIKNKELFQKVVKKQKKKYVK
jgi:adenylate cyclase, class 2